MSSPNAQTQFEQTQFEKERGVSNVTLLRGVVHLRVQLSDAAEAGTEDAQRLGILEHLASENVPVFLVKLVPAGLSFALRSDAAERGLTVLRAINAQFTAVDDLALVSTHAGAMRDLSGVMADIYEALAGIGVRIKQTGDAYNAVLCLVPGDKAEAAQNALRQRFALPEPEPLFVTLDSGPAPRPAL